MSWARQAGYAAPRPVREVTGSELDTLTGWLRQLTDAPATDRTLIAIRAQADFGRWPCIVCRTCETRDADRPGVRHRMTISGVIDHYRRVFGYVHELAIADDVVRVAS